VSYLDKPMTSVSFFQHISSKSRSHKVNTKIALDWFDKFCIGQFDGKTEKTVLEDLMKQKEKNSQRFPKNLFGLLQDFINYLGVESQDPATIRGNFNLVKNYLNWYGFEIYSEGVKSRLNFPKKISEEAYPLTLEDVKKILNEANPHRRVLYLFLLCTGMRIQEILQLRKRDLDFGFDRIMVRIAGKYTKTKKPRKTFVTKETEGYLKQILKKKNDDDLIFATNQDCLKSKHTEEDYFTRLRIRAGFGELRYDNGIHKITLHSFRSWFVTKCNRVDSDFGNALAGHQKYMKKYNRFTDKELCELYIKAENNLSVFDRVSEEQQKQTEKIYLNRIEELEANMKHIQDLLEKKSSN